MKLLGLLTLFLAFNANAQLNGGMVQVQREFQCASINNKYAECYTGLEVNQQVYLTRQLSKASCINGQSFNIWGDKVSVQHGCRAVFIARGLTRYPQPSDQIIQTPQTVRIRCESQKQNPSSCRIPLNRVHNVYLEQQHSKSACIEGSTYRYDSQYVHVTGGCRATFVANGY
ncbi:MAG: DUF3011 domain-containing protein [Bdellovibrionota bacterium]